MTASKRKLIDRWKSDDGRRRASMLMDLIRARDDKYWGVDLSQIALEELPLEVTALLKASPYAAEVSPAADLRGLEFREGVHLTRIALAGARFDFAILGGHVAGCHAPKARFDGVKAAGLLFQRDELRGATFVGASLKRCYFGQSNLEDANFSSAKLQCADLADANCQNACFAGADMRLIECTRTDISGADLSGVDMTEANIGNAKFDGKTRLAGTILRGAWMTDEFREFAERSGAILGPERGLLMLASLDGAKKVLELKNADGLLDQVLSELASFRKRLKKDPRFDWITELLQCTPPEFVGTVEFAISQGSKTVASQLD